MDIEELSDEEYIEMRKKTDFIMRKRCITLTLSEEEKELL